MKYYAIFVDERYVAPVPIGWYGTIDQTTMKQKKAYQMPKRLGFMLEKHMQTVFTDIVTFPCFMVSKKVKNVVEQYDSSVKFARIIFFDRENKKSMAYYIPFINTVIPLATKQSNNEIAVEKENIKDCTVFQVVKTERTYIVMRMDLVESILRRDAIGIGIKEIQVIQ